MSNTVISDPLLKRVLSDPIAFAEAFIRVVDMASRDTVGKLVPFKVSRMPMQRDFVERVLRTRRTRVVELKARRVGGTTLFMAYGLALACTVENFHVGLIAQNEPEAIKFGRMWKQLYADMVPRVMLDDGTLFEPKPQATLFSDHMIEFGGLGSYVAVGTAGSTKLWRGSRLNMIIGTEVSKWDVGRPPGTAEELWAGVEGGLDPNGLAILESTAYGSAGFFYNVYSEAKKGNSRWYPVFYDWRWHPMYALEADEDDVLPADRGPVTLAEDEERLGLTQQQARWRRSKIASMPGSTMEGRLSLFRQEYPEDDITCFSVSGMPYFDVGLIDTSIGHMRVAHKTEENGSVTYWELPRVGEHYIVGVDPGGDAPIRADATSRDYAAATVVDSRLRKVAAVHGRFDSRHLGELLARLGKYYNDACINVEAGPYGAAVLLVLSSNLGYPNLFTYRDPQTKEIVGLGTRTSDKTKPMLLDNFKELFETGTYTTDDAEELREMRNFHRVFSATGHAQLQAIAGHDDRVIATAMALWAFSDGHYRKRSGTRILSPAGG